MQAYYERPPEPARYQAPALKYEFTLTRPARAYLNAKRIFDVVVSLSALALMLPVMLACAIAVRFTGKPILFRQTRLGEGGRPFTVYKFRTMSTSAEAYAPKPADDAPTVTAVGRFLRLTGLDELPQLFNVVRGQMSLVGPRPEMSFIVERYDHVQRLRLDTRPGVTGLWQISPVRKRPIHEHVEYDLFYMAHRSMLMDLWILLRTPLVLLLGRHLTLDRRVVTRWSRPGRPSAGGDRRVVLDLSDPDAARLATVALDPRP